MNLKFDVTVYIACRRCLSEFQICSSSSHDATEVNVLCIRKLDLDQRLPEKRSDDFEI